jgi:RNA polymerase sigma factor (sigma-70 family)
VAASSGPGRATVEAAQRGDARAQDELVAAYLPLVYNIVGRALNGHPDVDDVVQETMLRALGSLGSLNDAASFRSWLVAITMNQLRHHWRRERDDRSAPVRSGLHDAYDVADPGADFVDLTIVRLGLEGQRREVAEATRWLDPDDQALLSLWWLEAAGELTRAEVAAALELSPQHTAVRVQRMKAQLETARLVVRALSAQPRCVLLDDVIAPWDAVPSALWRKRVARHARDCTVCAGFQTGLVPAEGLLVGLALVPVGAGLLAAFGPGTANAAAVASCTESVPPWPGAAETPTGQGGAPSAQGGVAPGQGELPAWPGDAAGGSGTASAWPGDAGAIPGEIPRGHGPASLRPESASAGPETASADAGPGSAGSPADALGTVAVGPRTSRRARSRRRGRRGRTAAVVVAVLLVTGGVTAGMTVLLPDGGGDTVRSAPTGEVTRSAAPTSAAPEADTSSSPSAGASAGSSSRKPKASATPSPSASRTKAPSARPSAPPRPTGRPETAPPSAPAARPAGTPAAQVLALTNAERAKAGCGPVAPDDRLARAAQLHSEDMSANGYFDHASQDGRSFADRAKAQGHPSPGAENIARGQNSPDAVMQAWMNSPGHRANILNCSLRTMGVGVVPDDWTWTQVFGY